MGRRIVLIFLLATFLGCETTGPSLVQVNPNFDSYKVRRVAILPFEGVPVEKEIVSHGWWFEGHYFNNGELVSDMLTFEMMKIPNFEFVERSQIHRILQEQNISMTNLIQDKTAPEIGKLLGVDALILGKVSRFMKTWSPPLHYGYGFSFSARMIDTKTGVVLWSAMVNRAGPGLGITGAAREECAKIANELKAKLQRVPAEK